VIINVPNHSVVLDNTTWVYQGGITQESVILNMPHASSLTLSQTNKVNILAPMAATDFLQGNVDGLLVAGDLSGGGHVMGGTLVRPRPRGAVFHHGAIIRRVRNDWSFSKMRLPAGKQAKRICTFVSGEVRRSICLVVICIVLIINKAGLSCHTLRSIIGHSCGG